MATEGRAKRKAFLRYKSCVVRDHVPAEERRDLPQQSRQDRQTDHQDHLDALAPARHLVGRGNEQVAPETLGRDLGELIAQRLCVTHAAD